MSKANRFMFSVSQMHKNNDQIFPGAYFVLVIVLVFLFHLRRTLVLAIVLASLVKRPALSDGSIFPVILSSP